MYVLTNLLMAAGDWAHLPFSPIMADEKIKGTENRDVDFLSCLKLPF